MEIKDKILGRKQIYPVSSAFSAWRDICDKVMKIGMLGVPAENIIFFNLKYLLSFPDGFSDRKSLDYSCRR